MYLFIAWTFLEVLLSARKGILISNYTIWYLILMVFCILSFFWADHMVTGSLYAMFVSMIVTYCFIFTLNTVSKLEICITSFVFSADIMGILIFTMGNFELGMAEEERLGQEISGNANAFSALLMMAAVFALWLFLYHSKKWMRVFGLLSAIFLLIMMALSGGRKTILAVLVCFLYFVLVKNAKNFLKTIRNIVLIALVFMGLYWAMINVPLLYTAIGERFEDLFSLLSGGRSGVNSDGIRVRMIELGIEEWLKKPILGHGLDTFKYFNVQATGHFYYAHNNYVELLYDLGIIGLMLYYVFFVYTACKLRKINEENRAYKILGIGLLLEILMFDIGGVSYYNNLMQILLCISYICVIVTDKQECYKV
jgi:O-antigen ligase